MIESATRTLQAWWAGQSPRERLLLQGAAGLAAALLLWFGAAAPALTARHNAQLAYAAASDLAREMQAGAREAQSLRLAAPAAPAPGAAGESREPLRAAASAQARDLGLEISRIQPGEDGALAFVFETADPADLFRWIDGVQTAYGASAATVTINRNADGRTVQANVLVVEAR